MDQSIRREGLSGFNDTDVRQPAGDADAVIDEHMSVDVVRPWSASTTTISPIDRVDGVPNANSKIAL